MPKFKNGLSRLKTGFTLIELLIVIGIIGVLAGFTIVTYQGAQKKARDGARKADIRNIQTSLRVYYNDKGKFPATAGTAQIAGCGSGCTTACGWAATWSCGSGTPTIYMNRIPDAPGTIDYRYTYVDDDNYYLDACLENTADPNGETESGFGAPCTSGKMYRAIP